VGQGFTLSPVTLPPIPRPTLDEMRKHLAQWNAGNNENLDVALRILFQAMPNNADIGEVAVKLAALNGIYATNIYAVVQVAEHIVDLGIDAGLAGATVDRNLIEDIARVEITRGKPRRNTRLRRIIAPSTGRTCTRSTTHWSPAYSTPC
jgi:hypothetical protein